MKSLFSTPALPGACRDEAEKTSLDASHSPTAERLSLSRSLPLRRPRVFPSIFHRGLNQDIVGAPLATASSFPLKTNGNIIFAWRRAVLHSHFLLKGRSNGPESCLSTQNHSQTRMCMAAVGSHFSSQACRKRMQMADVVSQITLGRKFQTRSCVSASHHMWRDGISRSPGQRRCSSHHRLSVESCLKDTAVSTEHRN